MFPTDRPARSFNQRGLHAAILAKDYLRVEELVASDGGVDVSRDNVALELAVSTGKRSIVQLLVQSGCCVGVPHEGQARALDMAIYRRHNDIVELLLAAGFNIAARNAYGESRLHIAACGNNDVILGRLLDQGFDPDEIIFNWTACHVLAARNHVTTLKVLLRFGCNLDARVTDGLTPILLALDRNQFPPCFLLIDAGCDLTEVARRLKVTAVDDEEGSADENGNAADSSNDARVIGDTELSQPQQQHPQQQPDPSPQQRGLEIERRKLASTLRRFLYQEPRSLKELARLRLRRTMRHGIPRKASSLPLPPNLIAYVRNIFHEEDGS